MEVALAFAAWLFTLGLHPNDPSVCEVWGVWPEPSKASHFWVCGACAVPRETRYLASALIKCDDKWCEWVVPPTGKVNYSTCEEQAHLRKNR